MKGTPSGSTAVMARRVEPPNSLDFFPTPPWATRALCEHVLLRGPRDRFDCAGTWDYGRHVGGPMHLTHHGLPIDGLSVWEPACGEGHMAAVLAEYFGQVHASDVFPYGYGTVADFLAPPQLFDPPGTVAPVRWIITNPPFVRAVEFLDRIIEHYRDDVVTDGWALLLRLSWIECEDRWRVFRDFPPTLICPFVERVPIHKGRWDPEGSTASAYAWFVWAPRLVGGLGPPKVVHIPPGCRKSLTKPDDAARFALAAEAPLFALDGAGGC